MSLRMKYFKCEKCGNEFEEVADKDETVTSCPVCKSEAGLLDNFLKQFYREGAHKRHYSWSLWNAGD